MGFLWLRGIGAPKHVIFMPNVFRKGESKHIFMMWFAIFLRYGYILGEEWIDVVREREWSITNLFLYCIYEANGLKFLDWHTWCHYPKERIWR